LGCEWSAVQIGSPRPYVKAVTRKSYGFFNVYGNDNAIEIGIVNMYT